MVLMLINVQSWLQKPKVWRFVCSFSSVVGLLCYAFSSSFNNLFGKWTWWKILLYIGFSFIICLTVLFAKVWECSSSPRVEAHMAFFILMITSVYAFFFDKEVKGKPDAYGLVSCAAFAIMSLALARLSHFGFEVDLLHFFCGVLTIQLMKINLWLVMVGGSFSYSLIILRSSLVAPRSGYHGLQDQNHHHVVIEFGSHSQSQGTRTRPSVTQVDLPQAIVTVAQEAESPPENEDQGLLVTQSQGNSDREDNSIVAKFMSCIGTLKKENRNLILTIFKHVDEYLKADYVTKDHNIQLLKLHKDDNLVVDSLPSEIIKDLRESTRLMVTTGLEEECLHLYSTCRKEFLSEILSTLKKLNMKDIDDVAKTRHAIKAMCVANRIVLPNERRLFEKVFEGFIHREDLYPALPGVDACQSWKKVLPGIDDLWESMGIQPPIDRVNPSRFDDLSYLTYSVKEQASVPRYRNHRISIDVLDYIEMINQNWRGLFKTILDKEGKLLNGHIAMITDLLDSSLDAISKTYNDPTLGYLFIINNRRFIEISAKRRGLSPIFGDDWLRKNTAKFQQNLELYQRSSWSKILNILKLDINESEPNVAAELMKNKLCSFNEHLDDICNTQATWFVFNEELREQIIKSIENILLPAYGNFIARLQDFLGNHAFEYIEYGMFDIQDRLNNLFLVKCR